MATRRVLSTLADSSRRNIASFTSTTHNRFVNKSLFTTTPSSSPLNVMQARSMSGGFWSDLKNKVGSEMNKDKDNDKNMQEIEEMRQKAMEQLATAKSNMENSDTLNKAAENVKVNAFKTAQAALNLADELKSKAGQASESSAPAINKGMDQLRGVLGNVSDSVKGLSDNETLAESKKRAAEAAEMLRRGATESEFSKKVQDSTKETLHEARKKAEAVGSEALGEEKYKGVMGFIGREIMFAKEFARAMKPKEKAEKKTRLSVGESIAPKKKGASTSATDEEEEDDDAVRNEEGEVQFMAPMVVGEQKTRWEQRFDSLKETVRGTVYKKARSVKRTVESSENEQVQRVLSAKDNVVDKIEDAREIYETSQHPLVHKAREIEESVAGETDQAVCIREFMDMDAEFRVPAFLEYMEDYMIPVVVDGFRRGDLNLLLGVCEDQSEAARMMYASCRAREVQGHYWDTRMLELTNIDFIKAELNDEVPEVHMSFQCQHVLCTKNSKGEVVEGDESSIKQVFYHWILIRDFESEHFDWKITSFQCQEIHSLAA